MKTTVTARHCEVPEDLKSRASTLLERLSKLAHRPVRGEVLFDDDHNRKIVELILHLPRGHTRVASAEADDFLTALDRAGDKLKHQLGKDDPGSTNGRRKKPE
jgi:ribosomal subunit interface protein